MSGTSARRYCGRGRFRGEGHEGHLRSAADIFDGLVVATPDGDRYIAAELIVAIHARGVDLSITSDELPSQPEPHDRAPVKWDLEHPPPHLWREIEHWLLEHLPHGHPALETRVEQAEERIAERRREVKLAHENPKLAVELGLGRPDLAGSEDCGVVDVNHAPAGTSLLFPASTEPSHWISSMRGSGLKASRRSRT